MAKTPPRRAAVVPATDKEVAQRHADWEAMKYLYSRFPEHPFEDAMDKDSRELLDHLGGRESESGYDVVAALLGRMRTLEYRDVARQLRATLSMDQLASLKEALAEIT